MPERRSTRTVAQMPPDDVLAFVDFCNERATQHLQSLAIEPATLETAAGRIAYTEQHAKWHTYTALANELEALAMGKKGERDGLAVSTEQP